MFCEKCGNKISEEDKFCNVCGASLQGTPSTNTNKTETIFNDGKELLKCFFSKNPAKVVDKSKNINSYVGGAFLGISLLLFSFVSCFNITQNINVGLGSINGVINSMVSNVLGSFGDKVNDYLPDLEISPIMGLVIPYLIFAVIISAVVLGIFYATLKIRKISAPSFKCSLNMLGATSLPITTALILNIILGLIFPQSAILIFVIGVLMSVFLVYEMINSFTDSEYKPIIELAIIVTFVLLISLILLNTTVHQIADTFQNSLVSELSQKYGDGANSLSKLFSYLF